MGYSRAGFEVEGVDIEPQPRYPFKFHQGDALEFFAAHWHEHDIFHASPPCQAYSRLRHLHGKEYPDLIAAVRNAFRATGRPYIIENVPEAPLVHPTILCGTFFDLKVYRHRAFETNPWLMSPPHFPHRDSTPKCGRQKSPNGFITVAGHFSDVHYARQAMGIDWMTQSELAQAIPPTYTEWIGRQIIEVLFLSA